MKSTQTLSRVSLETVENYRVAARQGLAAYRQGSHRLVHAISGAFERVVVKPVAKLTATGAERLSEARGSVTTLAAKGIDQVAERTSQVIEYSLDTTAAQLNKVADFAAGIENSIVHDTVQTVSRLSLPGAKVAQAVSGKVADSARSLAGRIVGKAEAKPVKAARKLVRKAAKSPAKAAPRRLARAAKPAVKPRATKAAKAAAEAAAAA